MARKSTKVSKTKPKSAKKKASKPAQKNKADKSVPASLEDVINKADSALIITATKGNIEVLGIKNANFAYQAKGLMVGALDSYLVRPISSVLRDLNNANMRMHHSTLNTVRTLLGDKNEEKK